MAEGWTRTLKGERIEAFSAGVQIHVLNPHAVAVMADAGVDISGQRSKHVNEFTGKDLDVIVTVCDHARESCPYFPASCKRIHAGFADPPSLAGEIAAQGGDEAAQLDCYRKVRDEIRAFVEALPDNIK